MFLFTCFLFSFLSHRLQKEITLTIILTHLPHLKTAKVKYLDIASSYNPLTKTSSRLENLLKPYR